MATFNADTSINTFSHQPSTSITSSNQEEDDYLREQKRLFQEFEKKKQEKEHGSQQRNAPSPLNPPASKPLSQQITFTKMTTNTTSNGPAATNASIKPSDDLLLLSNTSSSASFQTQNNFATNFNNSTPAFGNSNMFGNTTVDFNNAFNNQQSNRSGASQNLMDDLLVPERPTNVANNPQVDGRMPGDLDQGLQRMAQSLGKLFNSYLLK